MSSKPDPGDVDIRVRYSALGGVGGWSTGFETDSTKLTDAERDELLRLIEEADFFNVPNVEPTAHITDGFVFRLWIALDRRNHEVVRGTGIEIEDSEEFRRLLAWASDQAPPLFGGTDIDL